MPMKVQLGAISTHDRGNATDEVTAAKLSALRRAFSHGCLKAREELLTLHGRAPLPPEIQLSLPLSGGCCHSDK